MSQAELLKAFLSETNSEDDKLSRALARLVDDAEGALADVVARFDRSGSGVLNADERELAKRVLRLLHRPSAKGLELISKVLDYLDCNSNRVLEHQETVLAIEVLELFCKADSANETLSNKELEVLLAVLAHLDDDGDGVIGAAERRRLRDELWDAPAFLERQKQENALVREVLGLK